ncbi:MAG TPA: hypothetical protein VHG72_02055 [Polyangia bacterium]|nr:hypothetical protein [Polyangia bacterium]
MRSVCLGIAMLVLGCASSTTAPQASRASPTSLRPGPSLYETGRFAVVPPSSCGLRIDEGPIDRRPSRTPTAAAGTMRRQQKVRRRTSRPGEVRVRQSAIP